MCSVKFLGFLNVQILVCYLIKLNLLGENEINEKDEVDEEVTNGVTNINMEENTDADGEKKKSRRRGKKKENKEVEPESKEKKQTNPPSVPIHELYPTSNSIHLFSDLSMLYLFFYIIIN